MRSDDGGGLRVTFLGTGTSVGIPVPTCTCSVCRSDDPRNRRLRASLLLEWPRTPHPVRPAAVEGGGGGGSGRAGDGGDEASAEAAARVLVDTATDLRQQALRVGLPRVDAVLYTHHHADHILGLDELRIYNFIHDMAIPLYGSPVTLEAIGRTFRYAFEPGAGGVPRLTLNPVEGPFELLGRRVVPVPVKHAGMTVYAYRVGGFAYVTDCSSIPHESADLLRGLQVLVIDALRRKPHPAHFNLEGALQEIDRLAPRIAYLTHLGHDFDHAGLAAGLPEHVRVAHDNLVLEVEGEVREQSVDEGPACG